MASISDTFRACRCKASYSSRRSSPCLGLSLKPAFAATFALSLLAGIATGSTGVVLFAFPFFGMLMCAIFITRLFGGLLSPQASTTDCACIAPFGIVRAIPPNAAANRRDHAQAVAHGRPVPRGVPQDSPVPSNLPQVLPQD